MYNWSCPKCQYLYMDSMPEYYCFCKKIKNPEKDKYIVSHHSRHSRQHSHYNYSHHSGYSYCYHSHHSHSDHHHSSKHKRAELFSLHARRQKKQSLLPARSSSASGRPGLISCCSVLPSLRQTPGSQFACSAAVSWRAAGWSSPSAAPGPVSFADTFALSAVDSCRTRAVKPAIRTEE